jgi:uroporphyrinogen-III synthase
MPPSPGHNLWTAAMDLGLPPHANVILLTEAPARWDEILDARIPTLISCSAGSWQELTQGLWQAGCSPQLPLRLVESDGRVLALSWQQDRLVPQPESRQWTLALGWTHADEGWRSRLPLWGKTYLVTRAAQEGAKLVQQLNELGATAYAVPTIAFTTPDDLAPWVEAVSRLAEFDWVLFTSPNGVRFFVQRLRDSGLDLRALGRARLASIGPATARALAQHHLKSDLVPSEFVAEGLLEALLQEMGGDLRGQRFLLPRAQQARSVLPDGLRAAGAQVLVAPVYKTVAPPPPPLPLEGAAPPCLLFTSSSTVSNWVEHQAPPWPCYCIGPITAETARSHGLEVLGVADPYTIEGLLELLVRSR